MNRQINYIIYAFFYLTVIGGFLWVVQKISSSQPQTVYSEQTKASSAGQSIGFTSSAVKGKMLFQTKCASCHALFKNMTGPGLLGFEERGPWTDRKNVYGWIRNPSAFMAKNEYAREVKKLFGTMMTGFPEMTNEEIDAICDYLNQARQFQTGMPIAER